MLCSFFLFVYFVYYLLPFFIKNARVIYIQSDTGCLEQHNSFLMQCRRVLKNNCLVYLVLSIGKTYKLNCKVSPKYIQLDTYTYPFTGKVMLK